MADIDQHRGVAAVSKDLLESTAATEETTNVVDDDDGCFTFAAASPLMAGGGEFAEGRIISPVYPVFGRPRSPPPQEQQQEEEEDPRSSATVRVPLALLLLEERGSPTSPSGQPDDDGELDGVPVRDVLPVVPRGVSVAGEIAVPGGALLEERVHGLRPPVAAAAARAEQQRRRQGEVRVRGHQLRARRRRRPRWLESITGERTREAAAKAMAGCRSCRARRILSGCLPTPAHSGGAITRSNHFFLPPASRRCAFACTKLRVYKQGKAMVQRRRTMDDDDEFTFAVVPPSIADDDGGGVFLSGRMGKLYPVFGRPRSPPRPPPPPEPELETATVRAPLGQLLLVDREPSPAQPPDDDLDSVPAEMYSPWSPGWAAAASPARCRKSGSTGSVLRWRPRLAVGRSQSDGKEKFVFLNASVSGSGRKGRVKGEGGGAHAWSYYAKGSGSGGGNGARRTSFLPYKQDLVGLFANSAVFRRSYHPF
ncbi:hypothetical protein EJB05_36481, partial [Eragrostis curvula]